MTPHHIKFGTDGWRGVIADDFTRENVRAVAAAIAAYVKETSPKMPQITIGFDTRFHSRYFAENVAEVAAEAGCTVLFSDELLSTPALSSSVVDTSSAGGIMISASHNPPAYNGIKFKTSRGGSAPEQVTRRFEELLCAPSIPAGGGAIKRRPLLNAYLKRVKNAVDFSLIRKAGLKVVVDPMYGAGIGYMTRLLKGSKNTVVQIHDRIDPLFGGLHPEPIEQNLGDLRAAVRRSGAHAGLATDGDADRIGVIDETGAYLTPHQVFPLLLYYLGHYRKLKGKVVQAISLGYVSERIARDLGLPWEELPIGFKYVADRILTEDVLIGGEESGGYGYGTYLPERDGILNSMMIMEMLAATGKSLSSLRKEVERKYGASHYRRTDFRNPGIPKNEFVKRIKDTVSGTVCGLKVKQVKDYDGVELVFEDDSWLLMRPSGTEPVIRVYAETGRPERTNRVIAWGKRTVDSMMKKA